MKTIRKRHCSGTYRSDPSAFSLVEVVVALGICTFVLISIMGLFMAGLRANHDSESEIQAANLASLIISSSRTAPLLATNASICPIPAANLTNGFATVYNNKYVGWDGMLTNSADNAAYMITCRAGTNAVSGSRSAQVYLLLSWPPQASSTTNAANYYEITSYIPFS